LALADCIKLKIEGELKKCEVNAESAKTILGELCAFCVCGRALPCLSSGRVTNHFDRGTNEDFDRASNGATPAEVARAERQAGAGLRC